MGKELASSEKAIHSKVSLDTVFSTEKESLCGLMEQGTKENSKTMKSQAQGVTTGQTRVTTKVRLSMACVTAKESTLTPKKALFTKEIGKTALGMDMEFLSTETGQSLMASGKEA